MAPRPITKPRCHNCRRRKVKCDYARPSCGSCIRSGLACEGYDHGLIFVSHNSPKPDFIPSQLPSPGPASRRKPRQTSEVRTGSLSPSPRPSTDLDYRQLQYFLGVYAPQSSYRDMLALQWLQDLPRLRGRFKPLDTAVDAISDMVFGMVHRSNFHTSRGMSLYGQALGELREAHTQHSLEQYWHETLLTSLVLQLYEIIDFSSPPSEGWHSHIVGIMMLVQMAGDQAIRNPALLSTLTYCRLEMVSRAILGGSQHLHSSPWCLEPWSDITDDPLHQILDIMVLIPGYTDLATAAAANPYAECSRARFHDSHQHLTAMLQTCYATQTAATDMPSWAQQPFYNLSEPCEPPKPSTSHTDTPCLSLSACHRLLLIWVCRILLCNDSEAVRRSAPPVAPESPGQNLHDDVEWFAALKTMEDMAHAVHHCLAAENGIFGMQLTILPLRVMYLFATRHCLLERQQWCRQVADGLLARNYRIGSWSVFGPATQTESLGDMSFVF